MSCASATEADDKTEADDVEVAVKLAGPQPMSEGRRGKKKTVPLQVIYNITGSQRCRNMHCKTQDKKEKEKENKREWTRRVKAAINAIPDCEDGDVQYKMTEEVIRDAFAVLLYYRSSAAKDGYRDDRTGKQTKRPRPSSASSGEVDPLPERKWRKALAGAIFHGSSQVECLIELNACRSRRQRRGQQGSKCP